MQFKLFVKYCFNFFVTTNIKKDHKFTQNKKKQMLKICILLCLLLFNLTLAKTKIYIIGDSLIVGSKDFLIQMLNEYDLQIDAKVGRHYKTIFTKVDTIKPNSIVVINLFNNSAVSYNDLELLVKKLSTKNVTIVFINTHVKRQWRDCNNRNLKLLKEKYPQIYLIDWNSIFTNLCDSISCLQKDGVHLTKKGYYYYALIIASTINSITR